MITDPAHEAAPAGGAPDDPNADALFTWLSQLQAREEAEAEPLRYASPPCYLAEFSTEEPANHSTE